MSAVSDVTKRAMLTAVSLSFQMASLVLFVLLLFPGSRLAMESYQNVIFREQNEISLTRARWLVTFSIDLTPYDTAFQLLKEYIGKVQSGAKEDFPQEFLGDVTFEALINSVNTEFREIKMERENVLLKYEDYRSMTHRGKRSVLPFVGDALSYLFGVASEDDLRVIKKALGKLANTQGRILHMIEDSISIVNVTRRELSDNRQKINELISSLKGIVVSMANATQGLDKRVSRLEILTHRYWLYKIMVDRLRKYFLDIRMALSYLELQLNLLSVGHLSPSIIAPQDLRELLYSIAQVLPDNFKLASEPDKDIWHYYRILGCRTLFDARSIVVVVDVPLLDREHSYVVYSILNFPLPLPTRSGSADSSRISARFELESEMIAVNRAGSRYILLNHAEAARCAASTSNLCEVSGPVYVTNSRESCEMSLFRHNHAGVEKNCQVTVKTNTRLPIAIRVDRGSWVIATTSDLHFMILCGDKTRNKFVARAPLATIQIPNGCTAYSDYMVLAAQVNGNSGFKNVGKLQLVPINVSSPVVWSSITEKFPNFSVDTIPVELLDMEEIPIRKLLNTLEQINIERFIESYGETPIKLIIGVVTGIVGILILGVVARMWIIRRKKGRRTSEKEINLSIVHDAAGSGSVQHPCLSGLNREIPTNTVYPDPEAGEGSVVRGDENSGQPRKLRATGPFF